MAYKIKQLKLKEKKDKYAIIEHPYGKTKFKLKMGNYELADIFSNYSSFEGHKNAKNYAKVLREQGFKSKVVAKTNATGVYLKK